MSLRSRAFAVVAVGLVLVACSDLPAKTDALAIIQRDVKEDATCTLPINLLPLLKMQHTTKAVCVPRETDPAGKKPYDDAMTCLEALVTAGITKKMPSGYMAEWPDEISGTGFDSISPYERRARTLLFKGCVEMVDELRAGQFPCGQARAEKVVRINKSSPTQATVRYARTITIDPRLAGVDAACGTVTRPGPEASAVFTKANGKWVLGGVATDAGL